VISKLTCGSETPQVDYFTVRNMKKIAFLLCMIIMIGCGEREPKPVYLIDNTPFGDPGALVKVWFTGEISLVTFDGQQAFKIYYDERKNWWCAEWKIPEDEEARTWDNRRIILIKWENPRGGKGSREIVLYTGCGTPPKVIKTDPVNGSKVNAEEVNRDGIIVVFSEPISLKISEDVFVLRNSSGKRLKWKVWWSSDNSIAILKPKEGMELKPGEKYTLTIKDYFDPAGNEGVEVKVAFTTKPI